MGYASKIAPRSLIKGLKLYDILYYTTVGSTTFEKGQYPGLRAIDVECQGGGGGSGGCATTAASQASGAGGGGGGGYARSLLWANEIDAVEGVTVGGGGAGGAAGANNGSVGEDSIFTTALGTDVVGNGGLGGLGHGAASVAAGQLRQGTNGGVGGSGTGQFVMNGGNGGVTTITLNTIGRAKGGTSFYGGGGDEGVNSTGTTGFAGYLYGGGASGAFNGDSQATARAGAVGAQGIVIVWLYV